MEADAGPKASQVAEAVLLDDERRGRLLGYAGSRFGIGREDAEDILQDTALDLLRSRTRVRSPESFVFKVFRVRCVRWLRARSDHHRVFAGGSEGSAAPGSQETDAVDRRVALHQALSAVSNACRRLLAAYYVEGRSLRETARTMALADASVPKTISRCLQRLRRCLA